MGNHDPGFGADPDKNYMAVSVNWWSHFRVPILGSPFRALKDLLFGYSGGLGVHPVGFLADSGTLVCKTRVMSTVEGKASNAIQS